MRSQRDRDGAFDAGGAELERATLRGELEREVRPGVVAGIVAVVTALGLAIAQAFQKKAATTSALESDSLPDVPGLRDREAKEPGFVAALLKLIRETGANGDRLAAIMSEESQFNPQATNPEHAAGLLQWMPSEVHLVGATTEQILAMTATEQLELVRKTIAVDPAYKTDPAMAGAGLPTTHADSDVLWTSDQLAYKQNSGYDRAKKGHITAGDIRSAVYGRLDTAEGKPRVTA